MIVGSALSSLGWQKIAPQGLFCDSRYVVLGEWLLPTTAGLDGKNAPFCGFAIVGVCCLLCVLAGGAAHIENLECRVG